MNRSIFLASVPLLFALAGCHTETTPSPAQDTPVAAHIATVSMSNGPDGVSIAGVVKPHLEADLAAQIMAPVAQVTKHEGDRFRQGEILVRLSAPALAARVSQSEAALSGVERQAAAARTQAGLATNTLDRYQQLRERHSVTPYELDQIKAQRDAALEQQQSVAAQVAASRANVSVQRAAAANATLAAPFAGVVTRRMVDPGAMAAPGMPLLHLQSSGGYDVEFSLPDDAVRGLHTGDAIRVRKDQERISARVKEIAPAGDAGSHTFTVKASLPSEASWPAATVVQVLLPTVGHEALPSVPSSAVLQQGGLDAVLIVGADDRASVRYVTVGNSSGSTTDILTGVRAGDRVLSQPNLTLAGKKIEVLP